MDDNPKDELNLPDPTLTLLLNHYWETTKHKYYVMKFMLRVCKSLISRGIVHDLSKYSPKEALMFSVTVPELRSTTYGSDKYKALLEHLGSALRYHYQSNSHHPEHYPDGISGMSILDLVEMTCDWCAATLRHDDGDIASSIVKNKTRFEYNHEMADLLVSLVREIGFIDS